MSDLRDLDRRISECSLCPRLVAWRRQAASWRRKAFRGQTYWSRGVPNFGDPNARRLIVGLAPGAHGSNRTGRMFTGDRSGRFLFAALHRLGVANQPTWERDGDGLRLKGVLITAIVHCAPPANKPTPEEIARCRPYLVELLESRRWSAILCLGAMAWDGLFAALGERKPAPFSHGATVWTRNGVKVVGTYHPSQQNTFTGRLTADMFDAALAEFLREDREASGVNR